MKIQATTPAPVVESKPAAQAPKQADSSSQPISQLKGDQLSLSGSLKAGGERFFSGAVQGTKAAAIPATIAAAAGLAMSDPANANLAVLIAPGVGLLGASAAGLVVGGTANLLGAGKGTATLGGAAAGAAAGWALNNTGTPQSRLLSAGAGAIIGGVSGFAGSGAKLEDNQLNRMIGGAVGLVGTAGLALALSGGKDVGAWGALLSIGGGAAGYAAVKALGEK